MKTNPIAVVDGANVAYVELSQEGKPRVSNLVAVNRALQEKGYEPVIIADASLRHEVDDPQQLEALMKDQIIRQAPAGTDADYFILRIARKWEAPVISNDEFEQYQDNFAWIEERRVPLMIVKENVELYEPQLEEPQLEDQRE